MNRLAGERGWMAANPVSTRPKEQDFLYEAEVLEFFKMGHEQKFKWQDHEDFVEAMRKYGWCQVQEQAVPEEEIVIRLRVHASRA